MQEMDIFARNQPALFVLVLTIAWFVLLVVFMGITSSIFRKPYGDAKTDTLSRLAVTACVLWLVWRLGWLEASGIARLGGRQVWLFALGGILYFSVASLYSFYNKVTFNFLNLVRLPDSLTAIITHLAVGLSEEILFRGLVLYALVRVWGNTTRGIIESVILTSLLFAALHVMQVFTHRVPFFMALLLACETFIISIWWGALVLLGGSIWPAVMLHFVPNAVVAVQGLTVPIAEPGIVIYRRILLFSIPLGVLGIWLLV